MTEIRYLALDMIIQFIIRENEKDDWFFQWDQDFPKDFLDFTYGGGRITDEEFEEMKPIDQMYRRIFMKMIFEKELNEE